MTSQPVQTITIHILSSVLESLFSKVAISRSKDKQTMKNGQLIKYNKRNIFLQKSQNMRQGD